jgi:uncharacterized protein (TIGR03435 family)
MDIPAVRSSQKSTILIVGLILAIAISIRAQAPPSQFAFTSSEKQTFEVASIKSNKSTTPATYNFPLGPGDAMRPVGGRFAVTNMPLRNIIAFAFKLSGNMDYLMPGLPTWVDTERFDIDARAAGNPTKDQFRLMVQSLLVDYFKLAIHNETRQLPVFALVLSKAGKTGPQLTPHTDDATCGSPAGQPYPSTAAVPLPKMPCNAQPLALQPSGPGRSRVGARRMTLQMFASTFSGYDNFDRPIVDRTGLTDTFDMWLEWEPAGVAQARPEGVEPGPTFQQALQDQLGLKVESQKALVDVIAVDHLERPTEN